MPSRYKKVRKITNSTEYYEPLRKSRGAARIEQYATFKITNPTVQERASVLTTVHMWTYGDRLYKLAHQYYGDSRYWWVIAWWNGYCMESQIATGASIYIPMDLPTTLQILGA